MKVSPGYLLLLVATALAAGWASFFATRWFTATPAPAGSQPLSAASSPIAFERTSEDGGTTMVILSDGTEVYRINAALLDRSEIIGDVVRVRFTIRGSADRTRYAADLLVPPEGFPIELFSPVSGEGSDEQIVHAQELVRAIAGKPVIELRFALDPTTLASPEEVQELAAFRGIFAGQAPPADTPFRPIGIGYLKE